MPRLSFARPRPLLLPLMCQCVGEDGKRKEVFFAGIIDCLQTYTTGRKVQNAVQGFVIKEEISIVPPARYADRFLAAMARYFQPSPALVASEAKQQQQGQRKSIVAAVGRVFKEWLAGDAASRPKEAQEAGAGGVQLERIERPAHANLKTD